MPARSPCAKPLAKASRSSAASDSGEGITGSGGGGGALANSPAGGASGSNGCQTNGITGTLPFRRLALDDIGLACGGARDDHALFFELARHGDDFLLRL